jgi:heme-binding protein
VDELIDAWANTLCLRNDEIPEFTAWWTTRTNRTEGHPMRSSSWYGTRHKTWAVASMVASAGILAASLGYVAEAHAEPGCTASGLSNALGTVASQTGGWLSAHPEAEQVINTADEGAIQSYFATHQGEWSELQGIASPLRNLRNSCPQQVSPGDIARLFDAMSS